MSMENLPELPKEIEELQTYNDDLAIHQSSVKAVHSCPRFALYSIVWGLRPKSEPIVSAKNLGSLIHELFEAGPDGVDDVKKDVDKDIQKLTDAIEKGEDLVGDLEKQAKSLEQLYHKALAIVEIYWERFPENPKLKTIAREHPVRVNVRMKVPGQGEEEKEEQVLIGGILDRVVQHTERGNVWIRDFKSSSLSFDEVTLGYKWSIQCSLYRLLCEAVAGKCRGFIIDYIRTPTISMGQKDRDYEDYQHTFKSGKKEGQTETRRKYVGDPKFSNYLERLKKWYDDQEEETAKSQAIFFDSPSLSGQLASALLHTRDVLARPAHPTLYPRSLYKPCMMYNRKCPFADLCRNSVDNWPAIIDRSFEQEAPHGYQPDVVDTSGSGNNGDGKKVKSRIIT